MIHRGFCIRCIFYTNPAWILLRTRRCLHSCLHRFDNVGGIHRVTDRLGMPPATGVIRVATWSFSVYTPLMSIDRILISLGILLLIVSAVLAAITWLF